MGRVYWIVQEAQCNLKAPYKNRRPRVKKAEIGVMYFEDPGERDHRPRNTGASGSWTRQGDTFSLEHPKGTQACGHLDFSLERLISSS